MTAMQLFMWLSITSLVLGFVLMVIFSYIHFWGPYLRCASKWRLIRHELEKFGDKPRHSLITGMKNCIKIIPKINMIAWEESGYRLREWFLTDSIVPLVKSTASADELRKNLGYICELVRLLDEKHLAWSEAPDLSYAVREMLRLRSSGFEYDVSITPAKGHSEFVYDDLGNNVGEQWVKEESQKIRLVPRALESM